MKINVEVDCTPEEARRAVGLPDLTPLHDKYVAMMSETMEKGVTPELFDTMTRAWGPMGEAGMSMWRGLLDAATKTTK